MRVGVIGVVVALVLAGCNPTDTLTPDNYPVHPHMVPPPPAAEPFAQASCIIGLNDAAQETITRAVDPQGWDGELEEQTWWFADDSLYQIPSLGDCLTSWVQQRDQMSLWYSCAGDWKSNAQPFPYADHSETTIQGFVRDWYCDSNHDVALPVPIR